MVRITVGGAPGPSYGQCDVADRTSQLRLLPNDPDLGRYPYLWLAYLGFVFMGPVLAGLTDDRTVWIASVASVVVFLPLYFAAYWADGWRRVGYGVAICLLGTALSPVSPGANTYFIYGAYFGGYATTQPRQAVQFMLPWIAALGLTSAFVQPSPYFWMPAAIGGLVVGLLGLEQRLRSQRHANLVMARAEVETLARIAERERIARDLHDLLGQSLSLVALKVELTKRLVDRDPARAAKELAEIHDVARQALSEVRTAVQGYRVGAGAGLHREIANARRALEAAGVQLQCDEEIDRLSARLDPAHEAVIALAVREGVTNVIRHAGATSCSVTLVDDDDTYGVEIRDDGRGARRGLGSGLAGMRERVEALGGRFELDGHAGTTLRLMFRAAPVEAA